MKFYLELFEGPTFSSRLFMSNDLTLTNKIEIGEAVPL